MQNLLASILTVMGLSEGSVTATDSLSRLGIDSMQVVEVSASTKHKLTTCRLMMHNMYQTLDRPAIAVHASAACLHGVRCQQPI